MAQDPLLVRRLAQADWPGVLRIQALAYTAIAPESAGSMQAKWQAAPRTCLVACAGPELLGYLIAVPVAFPHLPPLDAPAFELPPHPDALYLHDLALDPACRGSGAAAALVQGVLAQAEGGPWSRACLMAIQDSAPWWARFGFRPVEPPPAAVAAKLASYGKAVLMDLPL